MSVRNSTNYPSSPVTNTLYTPIDLTEESENSSDLSPNESYAATTYLRIDDEAAERLDKLKMEVTADEISDWVGKRPLYLREKGSKISIRDARVINENSGRSIFEINKKYLLEFKIIDSARAKLDSLSRTRSLRTVSKALHFPAAYLEKINDEKLPKISKEDANKINSYFNADVLCIQQVFERACTESIEDVRKKQAMDHPAQFTLIKNSERGVKKFDHLDQSTRSEIAQMTGTVVYKRKHSISVANAVVANEISGTDIYRFSVQNLEAVPYSKETRDRFNILFNEKKAYVPLKKIVNDSGITHNSLRSLEKGKQKKIQYDTAVKINTYFGERLFDFEKILKKALEEAGHFDQTSLPTTKKRKIDEVETRQSKKQKTAPDSPVQLSSNPISFEEQQLPLDEEQEWTTSSDEAIQAIPEKCWSDESGATPPSSPLDPFPPEWSSPYSSLDPVSEDSYPWGKSESTDPIDPEMDFFFFSDT